MQETRSIAQEKGKMRETIHLTTIKIKRGGQHGGKESEEAKPSIILPKLSVTNCLTAGVVVQSCHTLWQRHATTSTRTAATGWTKMVLKSAMQIWIYIYIYFGLASSYSAFVVERYPQVGEALLKTELLDYLEKWLLSCMQWILCSASCLLLCAAEQDYCRAE